MEGALPLGGAGAGGIPLGVPSLGIGAKADLYLPLLHRGALLVVALCGVFSLLYQRGGFARQLTFPGGIQCSGATLLLAAFTAACLLLFAVYFPVLSGSPTTRDYANALELFETWYFA